MYGREELKRYTSSEIEEIDDARLEASEDGIIKMTRAYIASEADYVMDAMEARIKELESQLESVQASTYAENVDANMALIKANKRIKELKNKNHNLQYSSNMWMACCKLMSEGKRNVMSSDALAEMNRIKELETENARLKKQVPVFHFVANGDVPNDNRCVIAFTKFSRYIDNYLGFYHDEHHWRIHDKVIMWCELPTPPTTEESSATEKENG